MNLTEKANEKSQNEESGEVIRQCCWYHQQYRNEQGADVEPIPPDCRNLA